MKKKNAMFGFFAILIISGAYFSYKVYNLYYYDVNNITIDNYEKFIEGLKIVDTIFIKTEKLDDTQYLSFKNMKIKNDFNNFKKIETLYSEDTIKYVLYDENENVEASFWMSETDTYVKLLKTDVTLFGIENKRVTNTDSSVFLEKNNISNDVELFKYLEKNKSNKNSIFTSVKQMKENYTIYFMTSVMIPLTKNITLIDGDYIGYIFYLTNDTKEVSILKNDKKYVFTFMKLDYFNDDYIKQLLNTIEID